MNVFYNIQTLIFLKNLILQLELINLQQNESPMPIIKMDEERSYDTVILLINKFFVNSTPNKEEKLTLKERIHVSLKNKPKRISEKSRGLRYKQASGTLKKAIKEMIKENLIKEIDKYII